MNTKNIDYKSIVICIGLMFGFSGIGYGLSLALPYIVPSDNVKSIDCNNLNSTTWNKSPLHNQYKSLDDFKNGCQQFQHQLVDVMPKQIGFILIVAFPVMVGFMYYKLFGFKKEESIT